MCRKITFRVDLVRTGEADWGMRLEAELADNTADQEDELCVFIADVTKGGLAHRRGNRAWSSATHSINRSMWRSLNHKLKH